MNYFQDINLCKSEKVFIQNVMDYTERDIGWCKKQEKYFLSIKKDDNHIILSYKPKKEAEYNRYQ